MNNDYYLLYAILLILYRKPWSKKSAYIGKTKADISPYISIGRTEINISSRRLIRFES